MGNRSRTSVVLLSLWASIALVAAQGTQHFTLPGTGSTNDSCATADCQQGTCVKNDNVVLSILFPYKCQCNPGWATLTKFVPLLEVPSLPCNVPNCTLNANCTGDLPAAPPSSSSPITSASANLCLVPGICGHGTCEPVSNGIITTSIRCVCDTGYTNVLNTTGGYCVSECELQGGCANLNLTLPGTRSPSPPSSPDSNQTSGCKSTSYNGGLYFAATVAILWTSLTSFY